ncbi:class I SAM-dependent methyltransferase [Neobacillus massiliamazoniensis]|uniref:Putative methyltransferase n=1 Tax=Neobacillus massiliamazoniensis TaxID=1499688 RepID=A0A0U1NXM7_9BACI|nr:class I SAM-dependent methyltransferase [Neobacillus massiliamazoniensis]CRK82767.1 putative methyltransferase [Neobacillus massiliamazoniensis]
MQSVIEYYQNSNEESRLTTDNARKIEFIITTRTLDQYIKPSHNILELGAGTGIYSFYYAEKGNNVAATDITPKHIDIIHQKLLQRNDDQLNLEAKVANATNLHEFDSESFDVVLCLGPMYHLTNETDRVKCLQESLRVLKKGGLLDIAYINKHYILHSIMSKDKEYLSKQFVDKILRTGVIREGEKECFWTDAFFTSPEEMTLFLKKFDVRLIDHLASDGFSPYLKNFINDLKNEELNAWIYYIENSCREKSILGMSNHALLICEKSV